MKKGMSGRTKKRLSKQNRGTRKVGGGRIEIILGSLIGLFIIIGLIGKGEFHHQGKIEVKAVTDILKKYETDHETLNEILNHDSLVSLPAKTRDALEYGLNIDDLLKKSLAAGKRAEIQRELAGPVQSAVKKVPEKDVDAVLEWLESLKVKDKTTGNKSSRVNGIVTALNAVHGSRSRSAAEMRRPVTGVGRPGTGVAQAFMMAEAGVLPERFSPAHVALGRSSGSKGSRKRGKSWS